MVYACDCSQGGAIYDVCLRLLAVWHHLMVPVCDCLQGGIKAVIWTDTFQSVVMLAGLLAVIVVVT